MKIKHLIGIIALAILAISVSACHKENANPIQNDPDQHEQDTTQTHESAPSLLATWNMDLEKSYTAVTEWDDKKGVDAISGATGGEGGGDEGGGDTGDEDIPEGGRVTYMSSLYTAASLAFDSTTCTRAYTRNGGTTTTSYSYTKSGNLIRMADRKFYIVNLTQHTLVLETQRIYLAKGKDVYSEFMHLVYTR